MSILTKLQDEMGLNHDKASKTVSGIYNDYYIALQQVVQGNSYTFAFYTSLSDASGNDVSQALADEIKGSSKHIASVQILGHQVQVISKSAMTNNKLKQKAVEMTQAVTALFKEKGLVSTSAFSNQTTDLGIYLNEGVPMVLSQDNYEQLLQDNAVRAGQDFQKKEHVVNGIVGAILGSLIGVLAIVLLSQMGFAAAVSGLIMSVATLKGYELFAKKQSKKGLLISILVSLVMTYFALQIYWAIAVAQVNKVSFFLAFTEIPRLVSEGYIESDAYYTNMFIVYLFVLLGLVPTVISTYKGLNQKFDVRKIY
ncbi:hypothetical protein ACVRZG_03930 [Streptococcus hyovaginalis]|uniref:hypothetical protein n=1 Tax=Streptococcus hyovaginalis TaxID=149015 RepID=UPI00040D48AF|nr:hypothetical protein [Streptococcus hyovaginalis]